MWHLNWDVATSNVTHTRYSHGNGCCKARSTWFIFIKRHSSKLRSLWAGLQYCSYAGDEIGITTRALSPVTEITQNYKCYYISCRTSYCLENLKSDNSWYIWLFSANYRFTQLQYWSIWNTLKAKYIWIIEIVLVYLS